MAVRILFGKLVQLAAGAILGAIIGGIVTGDETYVLVVAIGIPLLITVAVLIGAGSVRLRKRANPTAPGRPPGIISTMPEVAAAKQQEAVLNPVSTAQPSTGVVLNGQPLGATPKPGTPAGAMGGAGRVAWRILSIVTIAAGAALVLIPSYQTIAWIGSDIAAGRPFDGRDMRFGLHQQEAFDKVAEVIGGTEVTAIHFYSDYISVSAPTSAGARTTDLYYWRWGRAFREGPDYSQPDDIREELFDAGDIDMSLVARLTRESLEDSGIENADGIYPSITRFSGDAPQIGISISSAYFDAYYSYTIDGELIQRSGSAFE